MENNNIRVDEVLVHKWKAEEFPNWFKFQVYNIDGGTMDRALTRALARGLTPSAKRVKGNVVNGIKFNTVVRETTRKTQSNGVMVHSDGDDYYGKMIDILELDYHGACRVVVLHCNWVDLDKGVRRDNTNRV